MKNIVIAILSLILSAVPAWGDEVDEGLQATAGVEIRLSAKKMVAAGVPGEKAVKMTRRMMENRFQEEQVIRAHRTVVAAVNENLPADPVMDKAHEGMAKNAPPEMILQAMEKTRARYAYAYRAAREITPQGSRVRTMGNAIAEGLSAGMTEGDVGRVMEQLRTRMQSRTMNRSDALAAETFQTLRTMARLGVSSRTAADVVQQALQHNFNEQEMNMLQQSFMKESLQTAPEQLARQYAGAIGRGDRSKGLESNAPEDRRQGEGRGGDDESGQGASGGSGASDGSDASGGQGGSGGSGGSGGQGGPGSGGK